MDDDKQLKDKLLRKNEKTVDLLIEKYHKLLWVIVENTLRGIGSAEDIEECVSDVFVRIWRKPELFDPARGTMKTYLSIMAKSIALNRYKSLKKNYESESNYSVENENTDDLLDLICREESNEELLEAIHSLQDPYPEIFIRRYIFGEKTSVVASRLGMDTKDIENRIYRGKNKLKSILWKGEQEYE